MNSCTDSACEDVAVARGLCKKHYNSRYWRATKGVPPPRVAKTCSSCNDRAVAKGLCRKHYSAHRYVTLFKGRPASARRKRAARDHELRTLYGITYAQYDALVRRQRGLCAVCKQPPRNKYGLCVDHCHKKGHVRGLLCAGCNTALGVLERDKKWMRAALNYLKAALPT